MLINGGGAIALLAFLGSRAPDELQSGATAFAYALSSFAIGVSAAALSSGFGYVTQFQHLTHLKETIDTDKDPVLGTIFHWSASISVLIALAAFVIGLWQSYRAIFAV